MRKKKWLALIIVIMLLASSIGLLVIFRTEEIEIKPPEEPKEKAIPVDHLIQNFPYTGQKNSATCYYAGLNMIFSYLGCNTSFEEILFYSGVGYSLMYQESKISIPPIPGFILSQTIEDMEFVASLYNSTSSFWYPSDELNEQRNWIEYWDILKENISNDNPIITSVNPFDLPSFRKQFDLPEEVWESLPPGGHAIVVIGYNESNNSICFNDPSTEYYGTAEDGKYVWVKDEILKKAVINTSATKFSILSFQTKGKELPKKIAFEKAYERNNKKLKGTTSAYGIIFSDLNKYKLGIEAVKEFKEDLKIGLKYRTKTILSYKLQGKSVKKLKISLILNSIILKIPYSEWRFLIPEDNNFHLIAQDKNYMHAYLKDIGFSSKKTEENFKREAILWDEIAEMYNIFLKKGFMLSFIRANFLIRKISQSLDEIIALQTDIISANF